MKNVWQLVSTNEYSALFEELYKWYKREIKEIYKGCLPELLLKEVVEGNWILAIDFS